MRRVGVGVGGGGGDGRRDRRRYAADPYYARQSITRPFRQRTVRRVYGLTKQVKKYCRDYTARFTVRSSKLHSAEIEHVLNSAECRQLRTFNATVRSIVRAVPCGSAQSPCTLHGSGHLRTLAYALRICMCRQGCAVPYGAVRYHAGIGVADMHGTVSYLNEP